MTRHCIVMEVCEDFEQGLTLLLGPGLPKDGILSWREGRQAVAVFEAPAQARAAIERTEHYRKAFNSTHPERQFCKVVPIAFADTAQAKEQG